MLNSPEIWRRARIAVSLLSQWRVPGVAFGLPALIGVGAFLLPVKADEAIKLAGGAVQLVGLWLVFRDIRQRHKQFNVPRLREWWRDHKAQWQQGVFGPTRTVVGADLTIAFGTSATASVGIAEPPMELEQRVEKLEGRVKDLRETTTELDQRVKREAADRQRAIAQETRERTAAIQQVSDDIRNTAAGSLHWEYVGFLWVLLGQILSTLDQRLPTWWSWLLGHWSA